MDTQDLESPEVLQANLQLAEWVRTRRRNMGLTQEEVVQSLKETGVELSRGHVSNLELGTYPLRGEHVLALDAALDARGSLIRLAEHLWGRSIGTALPANWVFHGERFHDLLRDDARGLIGDDVVKGIARWWDRHASGESMVVQGREQVVAAMLALLSLAAREPLPATKKPIEFAGTFDGLRPLRRSGLPKRVRGAIRTLMEMGWACRHHIPTPIDDPHRTTLVYIAAPLIACSKFEARIIDLNESASIENMLVVPGLCAVQLFATGTARHVDAAVIHRSPDARRVLEERMGQLMQISTPFVTRYERHSEDDSRRDPRLTDDEFGFREQLADVTNINGPSSWLVGCFPTATNPPEVYEARVNRRRAKARKLPGYDDEKWDLVLQFHKRRFKALQEQLSSEHLCRVIVPKKELTLRDAESGSYWSLEDRRRHLEYVLELMKNSNFQVGFSTNPRLRAEMCKWEVREGPRDKGVVIVQSRYTPVRDQLPAFAEFGEPSSDDKGAMLPVDIKIDAPGAVRAFAAYYDHLWDTDAVDNDQEKIRNLIEAGLSKKN